MVSKRKFKRDYIILEAKDMNFRSKERVLPKAFAKIEINDEKSVVALYVENLKNLKDGYDVIALRTDYERLNLGRINLNSQGKGEFVLDLNEEDSDIKAIALTYEKYVPLIGFKGNKIENYEELIFEPEEEIIERIVNRRVCSNQECKAVYNIVLNPPKVEGICDKCGSELVKRKDDTEETVKARLKSYFEQTSPLVDYYEKQGNLETEIVSKTVNKFGKDVAEEIAKEMRQ